MEKFYYQGLFGGVPLTLSFRWKDTFRFFGPFLQPCPPSEGALAVPDEDFAEFSRKWEMPADADTEYALSVYRVCDALLPHGACVFHGAAFRWKERAFLLTASSGVGKTTQLRHWQSLLGDQLTILNGDKPILKKEEDKILVCPSPWRGKEYLGDSGLTVPLAGIICLEQAPENRILRLEPGKAVEPVLLRFLSSFEREETVLAACRFEESLLEQVPVWKLKNKGDPASALLTRDVLLAEVFSDEV